MWSISFFGLCAGIPGTLSYSPSLIEFSFAGITASPLCTIAGPVFGTLVVPFLKDASGLVMSLTLMFRFSPGRSPYLAFLLILSTLDPAEGVFGVTGFCATASI